MALVKIERVRQSLIEQLAAKGADIDCYIDMVDAYVFYTKMERKMQSDIRRNGLSFKAVSASGKEYIKENPSIKNAANYNKQRLSILTQMGLNLKTVETGSDDEL